MTDKGKSEGGDAEIRAIAEVYAALNGLERDEQHRVVDYVAAKLGLSRTRRAADPSRARELPSQEQHEDVEEAASDDADEDAEPDILDGTSPVAQKWLRRSGISAESLSAIFSLGLEDIDLVAQSIPGDNKKGRLRNVLFLRGVASYLAGGTARFSHAQLKEAAVHYDAFDSSNFAAHMKSFSGLVTGSRKAGYTLTTRGLTEATALVKEMAGGE